MNIEDRLEQLIDAHRALLAQHTALMSVCQVMLPLISCDPSVLRRLLLTAYDGSNQAMDEHDHDEEQRAEVNRWLDTLSQLILNSPHKDAPQQNSGGQIP